MTKSEERKEIEKAMKLFKGQIVTTTKESELMRLAKNDYTDYSMRCGESGIIPGYHYPGDRHIN